MTHDEIKAVIDGAIPWWIYLIAFIVAFAGSYIGAYAKRKGENLATKEDYKGLLSQVRKTTETTETIKADISKVSWVDQQRWQLKRELYMELLSALYSEKEALFKLNDEEDRPSPTEPELIKLRTQFIEKNQAQSLSAIERISKVRGVAGVLLTDESQKALDELALSWYESIDGKSSNFYSKRLSAADKAYSVVLEAATVDLDVKRIT
ncbi:MAG: hypothetical protein AB2826_24910 [Candidatus Thiodiazotropha sp.]